MKKRIASMLLCLVLAGALFPATALAKKEPTLSPGSPTEITMVTGGSEQLQVFFEPNGSDIYALSEFACTSSDPSVVTVSAPFLDGTGPYYIASQASGASAGQATVTLFFDMNPDRKVDFTVNVVDFAFTTQPVGGFVDSSGTRTVTYATNALSSQLDDFGYYVGAEKQSVGTPGTQSPSGSIALAPGTYKLFAVYAGIEITSSEFTVTNVIDFVAIAGMKTPVIGETGCKQDVLSINDPDAQYTITNNGVVWYDYNNISIPLSGDWVFESGKRYICKVFLLPNEGLKFAAYPQTLASSVNDGAIASEGWAIGGGTQAYIDMGFSPIYAVAFDANGHGTAPDAQTVFENGTATVPVAPTAEGYTFEGWYTEAGCVNVYDFNTPVTEDVTLYAKWTEKTAPAPSPEPTPTPATDSANPAQSVKTGDSTNVLPVVALLCLSGCALAASSICRRKEE